MSPMKARSRHVAMLLLAAMFAALPAFSFGARAEVFEVIHDFTAEKGKFSVARLAQDANGKLYGTTRSGGPLGGGEVFRIAPDGSQFSIRAAFPRGKDEGQPAAGLTLAADGNYYGTTSRGGGSGNGTVFRLSPKGEYTELHQFAGGHHDGAHPAAELLQASDGYLYGTTSGGGQNKIGVIYRISPAGEVTIVRSQDPLHGQAPGPLIQARDGNFYGISTGLNPSVFRMKPNGDVKALITFNYHYSSGHRPAPPLLEASDGYLYGTTSNDSHYNGGGTIYRLPAGSLTPVIAHSFFASEGRGPNGLLLGSDGAIYGTTFTGGANGVGTVFRLQPD